MFSIKIPSLRDFVLFGKTKHTTTPQNYLLKKAKRAVASQITGHGVSVNMKYLETQKRGLPSLLF
jgi:hypothetical protein